METLEEIFLANLERELVKRKWKRTDLARAAGLTPSTLYPIWSGKKPVWPQAYTLEKIAKGLGISVASLVSTDTPMEPTPKQAIETIRESLKVIESAIQTPRLTPVPNDIITQDELELLALYRETPPDKQKVFLGVLKHGRDKSRLSDREKGKNAK